MPSPTTVLYRRDLLGRIVAAGDASDPRAFGAWTYNPDGSLASETLKAGSGTEVTRSFTYDGLGRPVRLAEPAATLDVSYRKGGAFDGTTPYADGNIAAERITYSAAAFPTGTTVPPGSTTAYGYDALGRLKTATSDRPALNVAAAYDGDGNLTSLAQAGMSRAYAYAGNTNKLASVTPAGSPAQPYAHDAVGAVTAAGGTTLVRDPATGQARRATKGGQSVTTLRDGRGRAVLVTAGTGTTATRRLTLRDGSGTPLTDHEITGTGAASLAATQIHGPTGRIVMWIGGSLYVVSTDLRGSTRFLYAGTAKVAAWLSYCAYGAVDAAASSLNALPSALRWRYTGQEWVEPLALYDYGARLYDPAIGRFLSPDPADQTPSPYMYVGGDPVGAVDPSGSLGIRYWKGFFYIFKNGKLMATIYEKADVAKRLKELTASWKRTKKSTIMKKSPFSISAEELKHSLETAKKFPQTTDWTGEIYRKLEGVVQFEHLSFKIDIESKKLRVIPRLKLYMINDPEYTYSTYSELSYFYKFRERILRRGIVTRKVGTESAEELPPPSESASWIEEFEPFPVNFGTEENPNFHMVFTHEEKLNAVEFSILKQKRRESWESDS